MTEDLLVPIITVAGTIIVGIGAAIINARSSREGNEIKWAEEMRGWAYAQIDQQHKIIVRLQERLDTVEEELMSLRTRYHVAVGWIARNHHKVEEPIPPLIEKDM
ncbi:hypothetical protein [Corynebacterium tapiri]|uniref:Uncharacterized protein n=1 Tax=Corynebacterium tapiri TaxID=1448266 RepID=A0A5C4U514_9CORY|nr:hypothetical protein [Corynebacterium tapiri]TNL98762.1 hypothetical protein FHE74_03855 [Corynebacterium tapiri]